MRCCFTNNFAGKPIFIDVVYCLMNEKIKVLKYLVVEPGVRKNISVIELYIMIQFKVMSRTKFSVVKLFKKFLRI